MRLRILDIPPGGRTVEGDLDRGWSARARDGAARGVEPGVAVSVRVDRVGDKVLVQGEFDAPLVLECARCLVEMSETFHVPFTHVLEPKPDTEELDEVLELDDDDLDVSYIDGPEFELDDIVREHLLLALPMIPVCRDECRGLCASCGANLNAGECGCEAPVDPRWAALKQLEV